MRDIIEEKKFRVAMHPSCDYCGDYVVSNDGNKVIVKSDKPYWESKGRKLLAVFHKDCWDAVLRKAGITGVYVADTMLDVKESDSPASFHSTTQGERE